MKKQGWEKMLADYIEDASKKKFKWGEHDCAKWTCDWKKKITGKDEFNLFLKKAKDKYSTQVGAIRLIKKVCGGDLEKLADETFKKIPLKMASRGNIVMIQKALGICDGEQSFFILPKKGLTSFKTSKCERAWRLE